MISKSEQSKLRGRLFRHLDGLVTAPTAYDLFIKGVWDQLANNSSCSLNTLSKDYKANEGYLNVALRILCSQGWCTQKVDNDNNTVQFAITSKGLYAKEYVGLYR
ncbi:MAG: class I SAM-dependent methyltransferase, partial [Flavobacteriaceae bacterium]